MSRPRSKDRSFGVNWMRPTARDDQRAEAWNAVDPNGTLFINAGPVSNAQFRIYGEMSEAAAAGMTEPERTISGIISRYPQTVPFRDMRDLRSLVTTSMRKERSRRGPSPTYARLSQLRGAIEESHTQPGVMQDWTACARCQERLDTATAYNPTACRDLQAGAGRGCSEARGSGWAL